MKKRLLSFVMAVIMTVMSVSASDFRSYAEENSDKIASDAALSSKIDDSTVDALSNTDSKAEETVVSSNEGGGQIEYKVTFNSDGGSTVEPKVVDHNSKVEKPKDPTKEGHKFLGWYNGEELFDFDNKTIIDNITLTARWEKLYKVTFSYQNGQQDKVEYYSKGEKVKEPTEKPTSFFSSQVFDFWKDNKTKKEYDFSKPVTSDIILTAQYKSKPENIEVSFNTDGGKENIAPKVVKYGSKVEKPKDPTKDNHKFLGWYNGEELFDFDNKTVTDNITLTAKWVRVYKVTFSFDNGRTKDLEQYYEKDAKVNRPTEDPIPAKDSYEFEYWTIRKAGGIKEKYDFNTPINADIHLVAKYKLKEYKVTFNSDGGSTVEPKVVDHNSKVEKPKDPTKEGHKFLGWYNGEELFDFDNKTITNNITLTARWEKLYKVTFSFGNGRTKDLEQYYERGKLVTEPKDKPDLGVESHEFEHWMIRNGEKYNFNQPITSDIHLVAKYKVKEYNVKFLTKDGAEYQTIKVKHGESVSKLPELKDEKGFKKLNWVIQGKDMQFTTEYKVESNLVIEPSYEKLYKVTFSFDNGRTEDLEQYYEKDAKVNRPTEDPIPAKDSYEFEYWTIRKAGGIKEKYDFNTPINADIHLVAKYKVKEYNVKFLTKDGAEYQTIKVKHGESVSKLPELKDEKGFKKLNWVIQRKDIQFTTEYKVESNLVIEPSYEKLYKVTFSFGNGRTEDLEQYYERGKLVTEPKDKPDLGVESHEFEHWMIRNGEKYNFNQPITSDLHLVAKYKVKEYTVSFNTDGGKENIAPIVVKYGSKVEKPKDPTKEGHTFKEWQLDGKEYKFETPVKSNITLKAVWEPIVNNPGNPSTPGGSVNPGTQPSQPAPQPPTGGGGGGGGGGASTPATTIAENIVPLAPLPEDSTIAVFIINSKDYQMREDGKMVSKKLDIAPIIHNSRTMLPVRITGEVLGIKADYDNSTKTAKFTYIGEDKKENIIEMTIGKKMMKVNGVETALTADIMVINGRMILPISDIQRAFKGLGLNIDILWNNETKEVTLKRSEK